MTYSEELVELVARALFVNQWDAATEVTWPTILTGEQDNYRSDARAVLDALSSSGRLVPEGSEVRHGKDHCEVCYDMGHAAGWNEGSTEATVRSW